MDMQSTSAGGGGCYTSTNRDVVSDAWTAKGGRMALMTKRRSSQGAKNFSEADVDYKS